MNNLIENLNFSFSKKLPIILQTEAAECGLICIAMIANYYGNKVDLNVLRRLYSVSLKGSTLKGLVNLAEQMNFTARPLKLEMEAFQQLQVPCVLHWNLNHFVVLKKVKDNVVYIHDPAIGERKLLLPEVAKSFTGVALELLPNSSFEKTKEPEKAKLSSFWSRITGLKRALVNVFLVTVVLQIFVLASPFYLQIIVDDVLIARDLDLLIVLAIGFSIMIIMQTIATALRALMILMMGSQLSVQMNSNLVQHLFRLPMDFFEKRHIGDILSRFGSLTQIRNLLTTTIIESLVDGLMIIGLIVMMLIYSLELSLVVIAASAIYLTIRIVFFSALKNANRESIVATANKDTNFMESVRGMQTVKMLGKESDRVSIFNNLVVDAANVSIRAEKLRIMFTWSNTLLFGIENIIVIYMAANFALDGLLSVGMIFAFVAYKRQFETKVANLIDKYIEFKMISLHLERLGDITLASTEQFVGILSKDFSIDGQLELKDINFKYSSEEDNVLEDINFIAHVGESIAIIGPSGCGKSTLMKVMVGLLQPTSGRVLVDGKNILQAGLSNYRSQIACVMQNDRLMAGSILDNICFFDAMPDIDFIETCAKQAGIHKDIQSMPMGYHSRIGDMGSSLSGGQIQRLILARALYRKPKILFLDEATSNLDVKAESYINNSIASMNITRVFIAHRPQTVQFATRIYKFEKNKFYEISKSDIKPLSPVLIA